MPTFDPSYIIIVMLEKGISSICMFLITPVQDVSHIVIQGGHSLNKPFSSITNYDVIGV